MRMAYRTERRGGESIENGCEQGVQEDKTW